MFDRSIAGVFDVHAEAIEAITTLLLGAGYPPCSQEVVAFATVARWDLALLVLDAVADVGSDFTSKVLTIASSRGEVGIEREGVCTS